MKLMGCKARWAIVGVSLIGSAIAIAGCARSSATSSSSSTTTTVASAPATTTTVASAPATTTTVASAPTTYVAASFESAIISAFNSTAGTDSVNGVSPKATAATCPPQVTVSKGATFSCSLGGPGGLTGSVAVTLTTSQGTTFRYTGEAKMVSGTNSSTFPLSGQASVPASAPAASTTTSTTTSSSTVATATVCGHNSLSYCFPYTVNGGHAVPPRNPQALSGPAYAYRLEAASLASDPAAASRYGATNALGGTYTAAGNKVVVVLAAFPNVASLDSAFARYQSSVINGGCHQYDSGTLSYNGQANGDNVMFDCPGSGTGGQSGEYFINNVTMATFTGPSASAVERFMVSWTGDGT